MGLKINPCVRFFDGAFKEDFVRDSKLESLGLRLTFHPFPL